MDVKLKHFSGQLDFDCVFSNETKSCMSVERRNYIVSSCVFQNRCRRGFTSDCVYSVSTKFCSQCILNHPWLHVVGRTAFTVFFSRSLVPLFLQWMDAKFSLKNSGDRAKTHGSGTFVPSFRKKYIDFFMINGSFTSVTDVIEFFSDRQSKLYFILLFKLLRPILLRPLILILA